MESTSLDSQLCFALYAASRAAQNAYRPMLDELGLTYPQWVVLLALWEEDKQLVRELGEKLQLDSGTLSPLLKRMETAGLVARERRADDARQVTVRLTERGKKLEEKAPEVRACLVDTSHLTPEEMKTLRDLARKLAHL